MIESMLIWCIRSYQLVVSPFLPGRCRFYPTCSEYTITALKKYGAFGGLGMGWRRILSCHPFNPGGYDPVE